MHAACAPAAMGNSSTEQQARTRQGQMGLSCACAPPPLPTNLAHSGCALHCRLQPASHRLPASLPAGPPAGTKSRLIYNKRRAASQTAWQPKQARWRKWAASGIGCVLRCTGAGRTLISKTGVSGAAAAIGGRRGTVNGKAQRQVAAGSSASWVCVKGVGGFFGRRRHQSRVIEGRVTDEVQEGRKSVVVWAGAGRGREGRGQVRGLSCSARRHALTLQRRRSVQASHATAEAGWLSSRRG